MARFLFDEPYGNGLGICLCYLMTEPEAGAASEAVLGSDPEEAHKGARDRQLQDVAWLALAEVASDEQVSRVLAALADSSTRTDAWNFCPSFSISDTPGFAV